ncbi:type VI secretion system-associated FHA domain protein TagH [Photobacterium damselae]|uniref:Type VI secretion system-associated FHA domain protein TagH n=1 Tax=Photobacterium damselae TaxID=38293 RepID=A0ABD6X1Z6_PHODM|nr:type VI secretion system-associated FHA domain protein TagH [Photobacterium damselae]PSU15948.1 type VI secretion system-associated FHA domain protein TagH [Photobacterium damselae]
MTEQNLLTLTVINTQFVAPGISVKKEFNSNGGTIGSSSSDDWFLTDNQRQIQQNHCQIVFRDGAFCITDNCNQTFINNQSMAVGWDKTARLNENDVLNIGRFVIRVSLHGDVTDKEGSLETFFIAHNGLELDGEELDLIEQDQDCSIDDPLAALDAQEITQGIDLFGDEQDTRSKAINNPLLSNSEEWFGSQETIQADTERDVQSAMTLKKSQHTASYDKEPVAIHAVSKQPVSTSYLASSDNSIAYAQNSFYKDRVMDEKTLDLLEEEVRQGFSYHSDPQLDASEGNHLLTGPLLRGLGTKAGNTEDLAEMQLLSEEMGASLQSAIRGLLDLHQQVASSRYGVMNKNLQPIEDNPLRLGMDYEQTVQVMFDGERSPVHLSAPAAIEESLRTVKNHNEAVHQAISEALAQILQAFSPDVLQRRFNRYRRPGQHLNESPESWAWHMYQNYYQELTSNRQHGFDKLFWEIFDQAYDKRLREKLQEM